MRPAVQQTLLSSLASILKPIAALLLQCGIGCSEFTAVARSVFVDVATEKYGIRGRPTNISRVAAMTGLSRKEVRRIREEGVVIRWTPDMETSPVNTVIHYWHYDKEFSSSPGKPRALPFDGVSSFSTLVHRYAGDIPAGALKTELKRAGTISEDSSGMLFARQRYHHPAQFHEDFIRMIAFSLTNLATTVLHNAELVRIEGFSKVQNTELGRLERYAWTEHLDPAARRDFRLWSRREGESFIERVDDWIGAHEIPQEGWRENETRLVGMGVYYFEEND